MYSIDDMRDAECELKAGDRVRYTGYPILLRNAHPAAPISQSLFGPKAKPGDIGVLRGTPDAGVLVEFPGGVAQVRVMELEVCDD